MVLQEYTIIFQEVQQKQHNFCPLSWERGYLWVLIIQKFIFLHSSSSGMLNSEVTKKNKSTRNPST